MIVYINNPNQGLRNLPRDDAQRAAWAAQVESLAPINRERMKNGLEPFVPSARDLSDRPPIERLSPGLNRVEFDETEIRFKTELRMIAQGQHPRVCLRT